MTKWLEATLFFTSKCIATVKVNDVKIKIDLKRGQKSPKGYSEVPIYPTISYDKKKEWYLSTFRHRKGLQQKKVAFVLFLKRQFDMLWCLLRKKNNTKQRNRKFMFFENITGCRSEINKMAEWRGSVLRNDRVPISLITSN